MSERETWFEVKVPYPLAVLLQQVSDAWMHPGRARREEITVQVTETLTRPRRAEIIPLEPKMIIRRRWRD